MSEKDSAIQVKIASSAAEIPPGWDDLASRHPHAAIFHSAVWQSVLQKCYPYRFFGLYAISGTGTIIGVLPVYLVSSKLTGKRLVSAPFSYICDPLAESEAVASLLLQSAQNIAREHGASYYELKCRFLQPTVQKTFVESGQFETYLLDIIAPEDDIWARTHKSIIQRGVNKAKKEGVEIKVGNDENCVDIFHRLNLLTCRKHGIPAQPLEFHREVWYSLALKQKADFLFAFYNEEAIAAMVIFYHRGTATYMYGASDERFLTQRPNHLLLWEAILRAKEKGMMTFDLGRVSDDNPGLKEFKQRWGATTVPLHYYYWPEKKGVGAVNRKSLKFRITTLMFSKMPLFVTARLTWLYKHLA